MSDVKVKGKFKIGQISKKYVYSLFCLCFIFPVSKVYAESSIALVEPSVINELLQERVENKYNVGIVVAIIDANGTHFYSRGKTSNKNNALPINEKTIFPIASVTKIFTTLLLAIEIETGRVKLKDPVQQYLPQKLQLPIYGKQQITLEDLATHTSGLPGIGTADKPGTYTNFSIPELYQILSTSKLSYQPGTHYEYSNVIGLLADVIAKVSNSSYEKILEERILQPLGLKNTKLVVFPNNQNTEITGYDATDLPVFPKQLPFLEASWAMYSNAEDLATFVAANMGIAKSKLYSAMKLTQIPIHSQGESKDNIDFPGKEKLEIGLGWNIDREHNIIWKNGNIPGYSSFIGFNPITKCGVVVLANTGNVSYTDNLALHLLNPQIKLFPIYHEADISQKIPPKYAGRYRVSDGTFYEFIAAGKNLKARHVSNGRSSEYFNLYPMSENKFFGRIADAVFTFSPKKDINSFMIKEGDDVKYGIKVKTIPPSKAFPGKE